MLSNGSFSIQNEADGVQSPTDFLGRIVGTPGELTRVEDGDLSTMTETEIAGVEQFLVMRGSNLDFEGYYSALEQDASIRRLE